MIRLPFAASSRFKIAKLICCSSPTAVEIISLRYHFKMHTVLILCFGSNIIDLSIFIDVYSCFLSIYWFSIVLLFGCIPLLPISSPSNLSWQSIYFHSLQHALIKSIGYSQSIPAVLLTGPSFATCSWAQSLLALPAGAFNCHWHKHPPVA